ncbi:squalene/phytoene synthase family protein [Luteibacter aegosomatissinici]|uniref:squalene/phytoene synthase family protein n=1 Tax=Luteibacter aegosomatissinici TaxID=2911539 RepID=UPI001FFB051C|nr:squalene/phytoene synthase family protein [Luteibacter aegosomatissinici]UPG93256.1 squalene/phytoene synthase family protein [Luteibacter aegosomatissinici]
MSDGATQSYIDKWLAVQPQQRVALGFVDPAVRDERVALAAFEQELISSAYGIREPQVAAAKLQWWAEELSGAGASGGRHPLTKALFTSARAKIITPQLWIAPVLAAMAQLEQGTPSDFPAQVTASRNMHGALAALENAWWFGPEAPSEAAAEIATLSHLVFALSRLEFDADRERLPLPMSRLARHGLSRGQLKDDSPARREAIKAQLGDLAAGLGAALGKGQPLSTFRGLEGRTALATARGAARATEPFAELHKRQAQTGPATAFRAWRAARQAGRLG